MTQTKSPDLSTMLAQERRARLAAERLLELKSKELHSANKKLGAHARLLSDQIIEKREEVKSVLTESEALKGQNTQVREDLERANRQVVVAERRLWEALETIQDGFAVFNRADQLVMANQSYLAMFDGLEGLGAGTSYSDLLQLITDEGLVDIGMQDPDEWTEQMQARWLADPIEPLVIKLWNETYVKLIDRRAADEDGGDMVCLALDITDTMRYEEELRAERQNAEAANRAKSAFLANMSHEIRTPMNGVVGMADLLIEGELSEEQRLYVDTIKSSGEALLSIINDVLDYSKIEAEKLTLHPTEFDLERTIHEVILLLKPSAEERGIGLLVDYDMFLPTRFVADPGRVRQILTNLVGNAVKFTLTGHVLVRVVGMGPGPTEGTYALHVTVEDTGIGIPEEALGHIFGEFNQVEDERNRKFEGTGLGLAITQELVELMEGEIWVDSTVGEGSCFGFRLELPVAEALDAAPPTLPDGMSRALIVEDRQINRVILERQLTMMGLTVTACRSGADVLASAPGAHDVFVIDEAVPDMSGLDLAKALRARGETASIVLISAHPGDLAKADDAAAVTTILQRPILRSDLYARLTGLSAPAPEAAAPPAAPAAQPSALRRMRILTAEDNKTNRLVFGKMVKDLAIDLDFAENGRIAVEKIESFKPDLIFMDISMPEMDGKEAARTIRAMEAERGTARVPICALTAHAMSGDDDEILASGIDHYLTKPLRKPAITEMIVTNAPDGTEPPVTD